MKPHCRVLVYGDSMARGFCAPNSSDHEYHCECVMGATTDFLANEHLWFLELLLSEDCYDVCILFVGRNDEGCLTKNETVSNIATLLAICSEQCRGVAVCDFPWMNKNQKDMMLRKVRSACGGVVAIMNTNIYPHSYRSWDNDGVHLNSYGSYLVSLNIDAWIDRCSLLFK